MTTPRARLGQELRHLREFAGLSGREFSALLEASGTVRISQSKVSRIEAGTTVPSRPEVLAWAQATEASTETRERLIGLAEAALTETQLWRDVALTIGRNKQDDVQQWESASRVVRNFQPTILPGLFQTEQYAARILPMADPTGSQDYAAMLAKRMDRQRILREPGHRFDFLIGEGGLHFNPGLSRSQRAAQLDKIVSSFLLESVRIRVLPLDWPAVVTPWHNFVIFEGEDPFVSVEAIHGPVRISDPDVIETYRGLYGRMWEHAVSGPDAVEMIQRVATEFREDT